MFLAGSLRLHAQQIFSCGDLHAAIWFPECPPDSHLRSHKAASHQKLNGRSSWLGRCCAALKVD